MTNREWHLSLLVRLLVERQDEGRRQAAQDTRDDAEDLPIPTHGDTTCTPQ